MTDTSVLSPPASNITGPVILLGSGTYYSYLTPETSAITIEDIAYGLAYACRFAGQCVSRRTGRRTYYSVAEHCVRMSWLAPPEHRYDALMHELGEGTCGDMTSPMKAICQDFKAIEKRCDAAARGQFGVRMTNPGLIKHLDMVMLATERRDLLPWKGERWAYLGDVHPHPDEIEPWSPDDAAERFLLAFYVLKPEG